VIRNRSFLVVMVVAFPLADACADFCANAWKPIGIPR
jgi:hypothetical protein